MIQLCDNIQKLYAYLNLHPESFENYFKIFLPIKIFWLKYCANQIEKISQARSNLNKDHFIFIEYVILITKDDVMNFCHSARNYLPTTVKTILEQKVFMTFNKSLVNLNQIYRLSLNMIILCCISVYFCLYTVCEFWE